MRKRIKKNIKAKKKVNPFKIIFKILVFLILSFWLVLLFFRWIPVPSTAFILKQNSLAANSPHIYAKARQHWVDYEEMSRYLPLAAMAAEDQKFIQHFGFDFDQINIAIANYNKGNKLRGASTITQQLAKNLFLSNSRSYVRKVFEAFIAGSLELLWSKRRIMEVYLNVVQFGPVTYGVHQAALENFAKLPKHLSANQAAWMLSVLPSPSQSKINRPSQSLKKRQAWVLKQMKILDRMRILDQL